MDRIDHVFLLIYELVNYSLYQISNDIRKDGLFSMPLLFLLLEYYYLKKKVNQIVLYS